MSTRFSAKLRKTQGKTSDQKKKELESALVCVYLKKKKKPKCLVNIFGANKGK